MNDGSGGGRFLMEVISRRKTRQSLLPLSGWSFKPGVSVVTTTQPRYYVMWKLCFVNFVTDINDSLHTHEKTA